MWRYRLIVFRYVGKDVSLQEDWTGRTFSTAYVKYLRIGITVAYVSAQLSLRRR